MRKQQTLVITLPEPCHESWDEMKPNGCGRFCGQCEKTVIDFTEMSDAEVVRIMTKTVSTPCGRFKETQLNRVMLVPEEKKPVKPFLQVLSKIAASLLLLQTIVSNSFGQRSGAPSTEQTSVQDTLASRYLSDSKIIRGHIIDGDFQVNPKEGLIGASIKLKGSKVETQTDLDGNFEIDLPEGGSDTLEISYQGYETQTVKATDGMDLTLHKSENALIDVIVTTPYGPPMTKANYTGAANVVSAKEIESAPVTDITKLIEGNVAGVTNSYSMDHPNSRPVLHTGGVNSMGSSNNALIVIDGVIYKGDLSSIDPKNILEMRILKDATATSLYGAKGANGVILVTTKTTKHPSNFWNLFRKKK